jgi:hypothetical protein
MHPSSSFPTFAGNDGMTADRVFTGGETYWVTGARWTSSMRAPHGSVM